MKRLSIRLRLTLLITSVFVGALVITGLIARGRLADNLEDAALANAEQVLIDSLLPTVVSTDDPSAFGAGGITSLAFLDADGNPLSQQEFAQVFGAPTATHLADTGFFVFETGPFGPLFDQPISAEAMDLIVGSVAVGPEFELVGNTSRTDTSEAIVVSQTVVLGEAELQAAVSTPRQPIDDSLSAVTNVGFVLIPLLGLLVAAATWLTTSRVLQPVEDIRRQVELTDPQSLKQHVPRSGNGDEIDRLAATMNDMLDRLHSASAKQRRFVSDASHELRSPITATLATLETTSSDEIATRWPEVSETVLAEQNRLARLVDDLLLLARSDEGANNTSSWADVDLDELVLVESARPHSTKVDALIEAPARVRGSQRLLERCLGNIVENACRHAESLVEITVTDSPPTIRIDDDGPGIPEDQLEEVFERFTRLDDARNRREGGAGLGLAIAQDIAGKHGALVTASNRPGGGARFEIVFASPGGL